MSGRARIPIDWDKVNVPSTSIMCPHCRAVSHFTPMTHAWNGEKAWVIQKCDNCSRLILTVYQSTGSVIVEPGRGNIPELHPSPEEVLPYFTPIPDASIPKEVADDYLDAVLCFSAGALNASVVMSRRAIETAAILLGANPKDRLKDKIKYLASKGLEQSLVDLATEIRLLGNTGAHPDLYNLLRNVQRDECKTVLDFLEAFLESLYIRPAKIEEMKSRRK